MKRNTFPLAFAGLAAIVAVAMVVVAMLGEAERGGGHPEGERDAPKAAPVNQVTSGGYTFSIGLIPEAGTVGELVTIQGRVTDPSGALVKNVHFELVSHHLEDDVPIFQTAFVAPDGIFSWGNQFWDGTEHELRITASPGPGAAVPFSPLALRREVEVEAIAPSLWVQLRAMLWLLLPVALGMAIGIPLGLRRTVGRTMAMRRSPVPA